MRGPSPFIVANPGSGTTLLRMMLDAHSEVAIPPETHFITDVIQTARQIRKQQDRKPTAGELTEVMVDNRRWADFGLDDELLRERMENAEGYTNAKRALRAFYELYAESQGKPRWGDKTPDYLLHIQRIKRTLPEAKFVHLLRDGRDVAVSRMRWRAKAGAEAKPVEAWAGQWKRWILDGRDQGNRAGDYMEVRYEDLVTDTEPTLRKVCVHCELEFEPGMLEYHQRAEERLQEMSGALPAEEGKGGREAGHRQAKHALTAEPPQKDKVYAWREEMSGEDQRKFEDEAGDLLEELGYPVGAAA